MLQVVYIKISKVFLQAAVTLKHIPSNMCCFTVIAGQFVLRKRVARKQVTDD